MSNIHRNAYLDEAAEHYKTRLKYHDVLWALKNLMAVINHDGGHTADTFPSELEAAEACQRKVVDMFAKISDLEDKVEGLERAAKTEGKDDGLPF